MVLFKRKPVRPLAEPYINNEDVEVWTIRQTGEIFADYEAYLSRRDFYLQHKFICQITGHSGLNFFDALQSELENSREIEEAFPEALKGPVLRRVQFQVISRIDMLVDLVYDEFRADYYPGEAVTVHVISGERLTGIVRDKTRFGSKVLPDGSINPPFSRYFVSLDNRPNDEAVVDDDHISRDRKIFTKMVLRSFIKKTVTREAWNGAPWLVKPDVAAMYHIDTRVPPHLLYENKATERKQQRKAVAGDGESSNRAIFEKKAPKSKPQYHKANGSGHFNPFHNTAYPLVPIAAPAPAPPPPPPIKYPIEDLQVAPRVNGPKRPRLKYFSQDTPMLRDNLEGRGLKMKSVGPLLETWDTLNVYCEVFQLDSFTFDDFVEALYFKADDRKCELFIEIHCAALKLLVTSTTAGGEVQIRLPEMESEDDEDDEEEEADEVEVTPEAEPKPAARATRSSLAKAEAEALQLAVQQSNEPVYQHRASDMVADFDWIASLAKREFQEGGWEVIMVGLLHQMAGRPRIEKVCEELLEQLAPPDMDATRETAQQRYHELDVNFRVQALEILCMLCAETRAIRKYMEECNESMTTYRKEKIDWQRQRKTHLEELKTLHEQRRALLPEMTAEALDTEGVPADRDQTVDPETEAQTSFVDGDETDEGPQQSQGLRRANDRAANRKRKREDDLELKKTRTEADIKTSKQSKQMAKIVKDIEKREDGIKQCEAEIATLDNDLREADCSRTRVLGKDRFWNRYYWFERNGMPYAGLPISSTADAGYANGCIWVQGPDDMEREGYIEMKPEWQQEYYQQFNMTVPERKVMEEGETHVFNAHQWGYYDSPEALEELLGYLDARGFNEMRLKKEILLFRERIVEHMKQRQDYLRPPAAAAAEDEAGEDPVRSRVSTRKQLEQSHLDDPSRRCLAWSNSMALDQLGHIHSEEPRAGSKRTTKKGVAVPKAAAAAAKAVSVEPVPMKTRSDGRAKKTSREGAGTTSRPTRQGTRYNF